MSIKRSNTDGFNPIAYVGINQDSTPAFFSVHRTPTTRDIKGYYLGDFWLDESTNDVWILVCLEKDLVTKQQEATWVKFGSGDQIIRVFLADVGSAVPAVGTINVLGFKNIITDGAGNTITLEFDTATDGALLIGGGFAPTYGNITSTGGTVSIVDGPNSITISSVPGGALLTLGAETGTATPVGGNVKIGGSTNITTAAAADAVTINLNNSLTLATGLTLSASGLGILQTDAVGLVTGTGGIHGELLIGATGAAPAWANITSAGGTVAINNMANVIEIEVIGAGGTLQRIGANTGQASSITGAVNVLGGTNMNTSGATDTATVNLDNSIDLAVGLKLSAYSAGVMQTSAVGVVSSTNGSNGQLIVGATGAAPAWATVTTSNLVLSTGSGTLNIEKNSFSSPCPPFFYVNEANCGSADLGGTGYHYLGDDVVLTAVSDDGSVVYPGDGAGAHAYFEAPATGKYLINLTVAFNSPAIVGRIDPDIWLAIETPARTFYHGCQAVVPWEVLYYSQRFSALCSLTAADKVYFKAMANTGTTTNITGTSIATPYTWISGFLVEV